MSEIYEGNSITVNNINKSKAKIKIRGGSYQKKTQGYNLYNIDEALNDVLKKNGDSSYTFTKTSSRFAKTVNISIPANTDFVIDYSNVKLNGNYEGNILSAIIKYTDDTDTTSSLYSTEEDRRGLRRYSKDIKSIQLYLKSSLTEGTSITFSDFMIYLGSNLSKTYEPYTGGVPSSNPKYLQEIQNVGNNINLYDKNNPNILNTPIDSNGTGVNVQNTYKTIWIPCKPNTTYTVSKIFDETKNRFGVGYSSIEPNYSQAVEGYISNEKANVLTVTTNATAKYLLAYVWIKGSSTTYEEMLDSIKIEEGEATSYSNYNCGSLGVTIRNKNLYKVEKIINDSNTSRFTFLREGNVEFTTGAIPLIIAPTTIKEKTEYTYILKCKSNVTTENNINFTGIYEDGTSELLSANKKKDTNEFIVKFKTNKEKTLAYVTQQYTNSAGTTIITEGTMILEGDYLNLDEPYEIHQEQEIIFPLAEGQKLYEGSYLAKDGIHNKRKQVVLTGNENWYMITNISTTKTQVFCLNNIVNNISVNHVTFKSNYFVHKKWIDAIYAHLDEPYMSQTDTTNIYLNIYKSLLSSVDATGFKSWLKSLCDAGKPVEIEYPLATEEIIPYTPEQQNAFYQLQNIVLYDGINHISTDNELGSMSIEVSKISEDYETYISSNGFFINSQNDIHYLIDFSESELPCMAEATETTVKAAGRNGDIVLSTTYDPNNFNIVCYTEDNLTQEEKVKEEMKLKKLLNSIKNKTIPLAFEKDDKFYKVKYSGAFSSTNFPKHLKFSIPLKTSEAYGKDLIKKVIFGNGEETSDTFEDVGAIFTIKGPANSPIISLNDYSIEYDNPLLEGDKLIINSSNSTITHINSDGVKTNAMRYYNHQFPKIENGKNVLKVLSGVNEANVSVEWYDYKF